MLCRWFLGRDGHWWVKEGADLSQCIHSKTRVINLDLVPIITQKDVHCMDEQGGHNNIIQLVLEYDREISNSCEWGLPAVPALSPLIMSVLSSPTTATWLGCSPHCSQMWSTGAGWGLHGSKSRVTTYTVYINMIIIITIILCHITDARGPFLTIWSTFKPVFANFDWLVTLTSSSDT